MKVSLNWIKKYVDLNDELTPNRIATDLTLRTVEVDSVEDVSKKYHDIVVGKILNINKHPNADTLKICIADIGEENPVQIVCGGSNLYEGEYVVVSKPGAEVVWHGEGEPVVIKETKMRGESSYGMICAPAEVYLDEFFRTNDEREIIDLKGMDCYPGQNISELLHMNDIIFEIDNKSLTNRPDLWGHYGIARELSAIYNAKLKLLDKIIVDKDVKEYKVEIEEPKKCNRYVAIEINNVSTKPSPIWLQTAIYNCGMRPINAIVDITNYVMMAVGQPLHAFDKTHVSGDKIIVRNAKKGENLLLLDNNSIELTENDLVISDEKNAMALAGIRGGIKDSILKDTTEIILEIANFSADTIRKSERRFDEKTDASIRYEKNIDTERVTDGINLAIKLFKEIFPESKIISYKDEYPVKTKNILIDVPHTYLINRMGKELSTDTIEKILKSLGYDVNFENNTYKVTVPVWRSTGDVSIKDDVMGDIVRMITFESFEATPLTIKIDHAILQNKVLLERRLKEYLAYRCGFNEIFTYPWIDEKYIYASKIDKSKSIELVSPPSLEQSTLRNSLIPGMVEAISKNLRYFEEFQIFEIAEVFEKGEYHETTIEETLPIQNKILTASIVGKDAKKIFYEIKGVIESMADYCHMNKLTFRKGDKPSWADINAYLDIICDEKVIGKLGLLSTVVMNESKIKRTNVAIFELNTNMLVPFPSRTNKFEHLPLLPLIEKDLSIIVDEQITWEDILGIIKSRVKELEFIEEYRGNQIPHGKKSIMFRVKIENEDASMTSEEINKKMDNIVKSLNKVCGAVLREE